jgi:hypothetical protein
MQDFDKYLPCESHDENRNHKIVEQTMHAQTRSRTFFPFLMLEDLQEQFFIDIF